jgi:hypothetical protein
MHICLGTALVRAEGQIVILAMQEYGNEVWEEWSNDMRTARSRRREGAVPRAAPSLRMPPVRIATSTDLGDISEGRFGSQHTSFYDLFRVEGGKIAEHWDTIETIPPREDWQNDNGKF